MEDVIEFLEDEVIRCEDKAILAKRDNDIKSVDWYSRRANAMTKAISILKKEKKTETQNGSESHTP